MRDTVLRNVDELMCVGPIVDVFYMCGTLHFMNKPLLWIRHCYGYAIAMDNLVCGDDL